MNTMNQIEFDKVKEIWAEYAITQHAKEEIENADIILEESKLRKALRDTTDAREMIDKLGTAPLQNVSEIKDILMIAQKGDCLTPYQLERVQGVLIILERLKSYLARGKQFENPLAYYDENIDAKIDLLEEIRRQIRSESVDDHASNILFDLRQRIERCRESMKQKAEQVIRSHKDCMSDTFYTIKNNRVCVPVKKDCKLKISGSVIDKSSTGSTLFIEPLAVANIFEEMSLLQVEEENEVYRILYTLTAMVADAAADLEDNMKLIEKLDFIFSKGRLSLELDCSVPQINLGRRISLKDARHPLMDKEMNVPLQFEMGEELQGIIITGPNTGGKTVAIKTVMLNCIMAQCGLHVTSKAADICMNTMYLSDIGDGQNLSENLSTFSAHIKNVLDILSRVDANSFVIMDELGSGTDPAEGMGIAIAILEKLLESGANFLVTTHYPQVKDYAAKTKGVVNARMTFDKETLKPTYQMIIGQAGESCAFYIAERLGMPSDMLKTAAVAAYGKEAAGSYHFSSSASIEKQHGKKIVKTKKVISNASNAEMYQIGDSVMVMPDQKIGIVCEPVNEKGVLRVQIADRKIWINQKRVKLYIKADKLYPENYDFSIVFDSIKERKMRHDMSRKYVEEVLETEE